MHYSAVKSTYTELPETAKQNQTKKVKPAGVTVPDVKARVINLNGKYSKKNPGKSNKGKGEGKFNPPCFPNTGAAVKSANRKKRQNSGLDVTETLYQNLFNMVCFNWWVIKTAGLPDIKLGIYKT